VKGKPTVEICIGVGNTQVLTPLGSQGTRTKEEARVAAEEKNQGAQGGKNSARWRRYIRPNASLQLDDSERGRGAKTNTTVCAKNVQRVSKTGSPTCLEREKGEGENEQLERGKPHLKMKTKNGKGDVLSRRP